MSVFFERMRRRRCAEFLCVVTRIYVLRVHYKSKEEENFWILNWSASSMSSRSFAIWWKNYRDRCLWFGFRRFFLPQDDTLVENGLGNWKGARLSLRIRWPLFGFRRVFLPRVIIMLVWDLFCSIYFHRSGFDESLRKCCKSLERMRVREYHVNSHWNWSVNNR